MLMTMLSTVYRGQWIFAQRGDKTAEVIKRPDVDRRVEFGQKEVAEEGARRQHRGSVIARAKV